jgi:hypothetical protein
MNDPTLADLKSALDDFSPPSLRWEGWEDDALIAAYWFAAYHYNGQGSNLYAALCAIPYDPKSLELEDECEGVKELYHTLEVVFKQKI